VQLREQTPTYRLVVRVLRPLLVLLARRDWRGTEHLPASGGLVVCANHMSHLDPLTLAHFLIDAGRPPSYLAKEELFSTPVIGTVVRRRTWPRRRGTEEVQVHWIAVDDGRTDDLRAFVVRADVATPVQQDDQVELVVTPYLGFVRSARVSRPAPAPAPPVPLDQLPGARSLPPVHWTERLGTPGTASAEDDTRPPVGLPMGAAALARQLQRLFAAMGTRR